MEQMSIDYGKNCKINYTVYPNDSAFYSGLPHTWLQYYNSVLHMHTVHEHNDLVIMLDNESIYNFAKRNEINLEYYNADTINRIIALVASSLISWVTTSHGASPS